MRRKYGIWFRFKGLTCMESGAWLVSAPVLTHPQWRGTSQAAIGRSGDFFATDNAEEVYGIKIVVRTHVSNLDRVGEWLRGDGLLSFSWQMDRACPARISNPYQWKFVVPGRDPIIEAEVAFICQPWAYMQPEPLVQTILTSGSEIYNPCTGVALPTVTVRGNGTFTVTIGEQSVYFQGITDGIVLNSELGDAYDLAEENLLNNKITGDLWEIQPGRNIVSWALEDDSTITGIEILPKWRYRT